MRTTRVRPGLLAGLATWAALVLPAGVAAGSPVAPAGPVAPARARLPLDATAAWPLQHEGRLLPLEVAARRLVRLLAGEGPRDGEHALETFWGLQLDPATWGGRPLVAVADPALRQALGLAEGTGLVAPRELLQPGASEPIERLAARAAETLARGGRPAPGELEACRLADALPWLASLLQGRGLRIVPLPTADGSWLTPQAIAGDVEPERVAVHAAFVRLSAGWQRGDAVLFAEASRTLDMLLRALTPTALPAPGVLGRELLLERLDPFGVARMLYLAAAALLVLARPGARAGRAALALGALAHALGLVLRWQVLGRAPVASGAELLLVGALFPAGLVLALRPTARGSALAVCGALAAWLLLAVLGHAGLDLALVLGGPELQDTVWLPVHGLGAAGALGALVLSALLAHAVLASGAEHGRELAPVLDASLRVAAVLLVLAWGSGLLWARDLRGGPAGHEPMATGTLASLLLCLGVVQARASGRLGPRGLALASLSVALAFAAPLICPGLMAGPGPHPALWAAPPPAGLLAQCAGAELLLLVGCWWRGRRAGVAVGS